MRAQHLLIALLPLALVACDADDDGLSNSEEEELGTDPEVADTDGDGLSDFDEVETHGTDPLVADMDEDGFDDGEEIAAGTDPSDWMSYERTTDGRWPDLSGYAEGTPARWAVGERVPDFTATDQFGQQITLEQFYGNVILVDFGAGWCGPCRQVAVTAEDMYRQRADDGFLIIHYMIDDNSNTGAIEDGTFVAAWADQYGLTFPVVSDDSRAAISDAARSGLYQGGIPFMALLDQELKVVQGGRGAGAEGQLKAQADILLDQ